MAETFSQGIERVTHMNRREVLWELLKEDLKITFEEPSNEDEMCRVLLDGYGVEIVHFPEDHTKELQESLTKLCACNVYIMRGEDMQNSGSLRYLGDGTFYVRWSGGKFTFSLENVEKINGFYIYLRSL